MSKFLLSPTPVVDNSVPDVRSLEYELNDIHLTFKNQFGEIEMIDQLVKNAQTALSLYQKCGVTNDTLSVVENLMTNVTTVETATEGLIDAIKTGCQKVIEFIKNLIKKIVGFIRDKIVALISRTKTRKDEILAELNKLNDDQISHAASITEMRHIVNGPSDDVIDVLDNGKILLNASYCLSANALIEMQRTFVQTTNWLKMRAKTDVSSNSDPREWAREAIAQITKAGTPEEKQDALNQIVERSRTAVEKAEKEREEIVDNVNSLLRKYTDSTADGQLNIDHEPFSRMGLTSKAAIQKVLDTIDTLTETGKTTYNELLPIKSDCEKLERDMQSLSNLRSATTSDDVIATALSAVYRERSALVGVLSERIEAHLRIILVCANSGQRAGYGLLRWLRTINNMTSSNQQQQNS